jgi:hypothetical protein
VRNWRRVVKGVGIGRIIRREIVLPEANVDGEASPDPARRDLLDPPAPALHSPARWPRSSEWARWMDEL